MFRAGDQAGGYFPTQAEEAAYLRRVLWNGKEGIYARAVRELTAAEIDAAIPAVVATLEGISTSAQGGAIDRWRKHRGSLAILGLWLISESRARCGPRYVAEKASVVALQYGSPSPSWTAPDWFASDQILDLLN